MYINENLKKIYLKDFPKLFANHQRPTYLQSMSGIFEKMLKTVIELLHGRLPNHMEEVYTAMGK